MLAVYVSGHGFGHATRTAEVLRVVRAHAPLLRITVVTTAPEFLFEGAVGAPIEVRRVAVDVGLVQQGALVIDEGASLAAWRAFEAGRDALVRTESAWLRGTGARLVLGDIPPLAFAAAAAAGVRSVALGNFSWDWIYRHLARRQPAFEPAARHAAESYAAAGLLLRLPFAGDLGAFPRILDVPLIARRPALAKAEARRRLGLDGRPAVLLSFGGLGLPELSPTAFASLPQYQLLLTGSPPEGPLPANVRCLGHGDLGAVGLGYPDLVGAVDVVVTKPGYGIVSDCIGAGVRMMYTERGDFPEYPIMVAEMERFLAAIHVSNDQLRGGRIGPALEKVLAMPQPAPPPLDGAAVVARRLLEAL